MAMTKSEQLQKLESKVSVARKQTSAAARAKKWIIGGLLVVGSVIGAGVGTNHTSEERQNIYDSYRQSPEAVVPFENLGYEDIFDLWNENDLGNDVNTLLSGGQVYVRNELEIVPGPNGNSLIVTNKNGTEAAIEIPASFLNVVNNILYFRNDLNRDIYSYHLTSGALNVIYAGNVGEVFISKDLIYFTDFDSESGIYSITLQGGNKECVIEHPVTSFAVCGDHIIYLDTNSDLFSMAFGDEAPKKLVGKIERFFIGKRIYVESKNTVFSFAPTGSDARKEYISLNDTMCLVGYLDGILFYQENGKLKYLAKEAANTVCSGNYSRYASLSKNEDGTIFTVAYIPGSNRELLRLDPIPESGGDDNGG